MQGVAKKKSLCVTDGLYFKQHFWKFADPGSKTQNGFLSAVLSTLGSIFDHLLKIGSIQSNTFLLPPKFGDLGLKHLLIV